MVDVIFLIPAVMFGLIGAVGTYRHATRRKIDQPVKWSAVVDLTALLNSLAINQLGFIALHTVTNVYYPVKYPIAVFAVTAVICGLVVQWYQKTAIASV